MTPHDKTAAECSSPIDAAVLVDYWLALLPDAEQDAVEEHLFACDACGDRLRAAIDLSEGLRTLARSGSLRVVVADDLVQHVVSAGRRVRTYAVASGETVACTVSADDEFLVARLAVELRDAGRVDLSFCDAAGVERQRMSDIPVSRDGRRRPFPGVRSRSRRRGPSATMIARLLAVDVGGAERLLGEYTFHHTRTIPGPPGWEW